MNQCPKFKPDAFMMVDGLDTPIERVCKNCHWEGCQYCGPANFPKAPDPHEDRTPIGDRRPVDPVSTSDPEWEG